MGKRPVFQVVGRGNLVLREEDLVGKDLLIELDGASKSQLEGT